MKEINNIEWLHGSLEILKERPLVPFAEEVIDTLDALSKALMHDPQSRLYPDVVTFAFFCRRGNLMKLKENSQLSTFNLQLRLGRGTIFHIAPSNVPVNFAYSVVAGLLAGNTNVVRVSQKQFPQVDIIVKHMREIEMKRLAVVRYPYESNANEVFSAMCDVRVIWGGDATIATIRQNAIPPRAFDICFADRYSIAAINSDELNTDKLNPENLKQLAERFYNDTYLFDQNACSAPHLVVWTGNHVEGAKKLFWNAVQRVTEQKYQFQDVMAVDKLTAFYKQACAMPTHDEETKNNILRRVEIDALPQDIDSFRCAGGYFTEYTAQSLDEIAPIVNGKYQTLAYYGFNQQELSHFILSNRLTGIDRIVPFGETTAFSLTWDGMNLIERMSRIIDIF